MGVGCLELINVYVFLGMFGKENFNKGRAIKASLLLTDLCSLSAPDCFHPGEASERPVPDAGRV